MSDQVLKRDAATALSGVGSQSEPFVLDPATWQADFAAFKAMVDAIYAAPVFGAAPPSAYLWERGGFGNFTMESP